MHFFCIMINLGSLVIINCVAATRYNSCAYYQSYGRPFDYADRAFCQSLNGNVKYINIAMIILGATCMFLFVNFFFKLIAVFNYSQSNRE